jgi:hypothetical protein
VIVGREALDRYLEQIERNIQRAQARVTGQARLVASARNADRDVAAAEELLSLSEDVLRSFVATRDRLRTELGTAQSGRFRDGDDGKK